MSTARMLHQNSKPESLDFAAYHNSVAIHEFDNFTRYVFRDSSILIIGKDGEVTVYEDDA